MKQLIYLLGFFLVFTQSACTLGWGDDDDDLPDTNCTTCPDNDDDIVIDTNDDDDDTNNGTVNCEQEDLNHYIRGKYKNVSSPDFFDITTSNDITYDDVALENTLSEDVLINIKGVRITTDETLNIEDIKIRECSNEVCSCDDWIEDVEFTQSNSVDQSNLLVALVLDMSASMSDNIEDLQEYAKDFAKDILEEDPDNYVVIIPFSEEISVDALRNIDELEEVYGAIEGFALGNNKTKLYEAVWKGIQELEESNLEGHKTLVVFTDGRDNDSDNPSGLVQQIQDSPFTRFALGLNGDGYEENHLKQILGSDMEDNYTYVPSISALENAFEQVNGQVQDVFDIKYERSGQLLNEPIEINFGFDF